MSDNPPIQYNQKYGRTWADLLTSSGGIIFLTLFLIVAVYFGWDYVASIPMWIYASVLITPILWVPWLNNRAKEDSNLFIVTEGPMQISEYRVGRRVDVEIEGAGIPVTSRSGVPRVILTEFNPNTMRGKGSELAEFTHFEMARDLSTLDRLSKAFSEHLRSERITQELIAVEVEKRVKQLSERWIGIAMATLEPEELENALNLQQFENEIHTTVDEVLDFE